MYFDITGITSCMYMIHLLCFPEAETASFNGGSRITYSLDAYGQGIQSRTDYIRMRFKTDKANGILLFADGNQGDYIIVEIYQGHLYLHLDLGKNDILNPLIVG